jgi:hypothetical protein
LHKFLLPLGDLNSQFRTRAHGGWHGMRVRPVAGIARKCCLHVCHCFPSRSWPRVASHLHMNLLVFKKVKHMILLLAACLLATCMVRVRHEWADRVCSSSLRGLYLSQILQVYGFVFPLYSRLPSSHSLVSPEQKGILVATADVSVPLSRPAGETLVAATGHVP